ncbi:hypothetical protein D9V84_03415 [Bacteroidetes/Chlorobi group bacterium Naka2016]|jgi:hypothetical protein|nr:MAG: hypothetical protein D9V84_03415 [Bacteroidetes/Chlorobi group bacterium Naka2016]
MDTAVASLISNIEFGNPISFESMTVIPLFVNSNGSSLNFLSLNESIESKSLEITETSASGTVPFLLVKNFGENPVVILEGEELIGLKQNRILNTTVVIKEKSETKIPVSCCEAGRWAYRRPYTPSERFTISDTSENEPVLPEINSESIAPALLRASKIEQVTKNLKSSESYHSNQREVWNLIDNYHNRLKSHSQTGALQDAFKKKSNDIYSYEKSFPMIEKQKGVLVLFNGEPVGMDLFYSEKFYSKVHQKLIRGYSLDAILVEKEAKEFDPIAVAKDFLDSILNSNETKRQSATYGWDIRYESDKIAGFSILYDNVVVHSAFFSLTQRGRPMIRY